MTLDENIYKDPFTFDPTRFLPQPIGRNEPHPGALFGFGRRSVGYQSHWGLLIIFGISRVCPGRYLAADSLWIAVATMLLTLSISKEIGEDGIPITPEVVFDTGITRFDICGCSY